MKRGLKFTDSDTIFSLLLFLFQITNLALERFDASMPSPCWFFQKAMLLLEANSDAIDQVTLDDLDSLLTGELPTLTGAHRISLKLSKRLTYQIGNSSSG